MIPNERVDDDGNVLLNRGCGEHSGRWFFEEFWLDDSSCCRATVEYHAQWDNEMRTFRIADAEVSNIIFFGDDGEELEVGLAQQEFVAECKTNIVKHFMESCLDDVHTFEMGELA